MEIGNTFRKVRSLYDVFQVFQTLVLRLKKVKIWECECGNKDQTNIIVAADGEVVCGKCGTVLGEVARKESGKLEEEVDSWDGEADLNRKILEDRVSKKGWQF